MTVKISELPAATDFESGDVLPIVQGGSTKKLDADGNWNFASVTIAGTNVTTAINAKAEVDVYTTTIDGSGTSPSDWTQATGSDPWIATKTVSGILSTDVPVADVDLSSVIFADVPDTQADWGLVYRVDASADDEVKFYATEEPTKDLTVQIQVVR